IDKQLSNMVLPSLERELSQGLENPNSVKEIRLAIKSLRSNKTLRPDGFSIHFYNQLSIKDEIRHTFCLKFELQNSSKSDYCYIELFFFLPKMP
uniref:Uncharacterized protein n=1 Tax=Apteryx owenii TaxID=8824 RepID=A0A8B9PAQ6_APTOW